MSLTIPYADRDFNSVLTDLKLQIPDITDQWNDFLDSDIGYALLKTFAILSDHNGFHLDRQAAECFLQVCERRASGVAYSKALGYTPAAVNAATTTLVISISSPYNEDIVIPEGVSVSLEGKPFFTVAPTVIQSGSLNTEVLIKQGSVFSQSSISPGIPWMKFNVPINISDVTVMVDGIKWVETASFVFPINKNSYRFYEDTSSRVIAFGSGSNTTIPPAGSVVSISGTVCSGASGNTIYSNSTATIASPVYNSLGQNIVNILSARAPSSASGGSDLESLESIKNNAPAYYTTQNRAVTAADYEAIARSIPGVTEAVAWGGETVGRYGEVFICVVGSGGTPDSLISAVEFALAGKHVLPMIVNVVAPNHVALNLTIDAYTAYPYNLSSTRSLIDQAMISFFDSTTVGQIFEMSDFIGILRSQQGMSYVDVKVSITLVGNCTNGVSKFELPLNLDMNTLEVVDTGGVIVWSPSDGYTISGSIISVLTPGSINGPITMNAYSLYPDIYLVPGQRMQRGNVQINMHKGGSAI